MRAADFIVRSLEVHGVKRVYCVPGESYLALLDALHDSAVQVIVCRHEGGAGFMACAEAKMTGKPAVVLVSRGPGAANASIALHMAEQDALPVIFMVGQVSREERRRGAFQEVDYQQFFGGMAKDVYEVNEAAKLPELMPRGFRLAQAGVPGPVVYALPEDMLYDEVSAEMVVTFPLPHVQHSARSVDDIQGLIDRAERPLLVAGSRLRTPEGKAALKSFAEAQRIPIALTWKNQDLFDNGSALYAGHIGLGIPESYRSMLADSDLIIAAGTRLGDISSVGFTFPAVPSPAQTVVHIYPDGAPLGKKFRADYPLIADPAAVLNDLSFSARVVSSTREAWVSKLNGLVRELQAFTPRETTDGVDFGRVVMALAKHAPGNAVITTDSGNMSTWAHQHWVMTPDNLLIGGIAGAMGLGVPAAIVASLIEPQRTVICLVGDGGILMTGQELATAMAYGATPKIVISNNGIYGTIRTHQEREFPGRVSGTNLFNPDFTAWSRSFGAESFTLGLGDDVDAVVKDFLASPRAAVLHVKSSAYSLSAFGTLVKTD